MLVNQNLIGLISLTKSRNFEVLWILSSFQNMIKPQNLGPWLMKFNQSNFNLQLPGSYLACSYCYCKQNIFFKVEGIPDNFFFTFFNCAIVVEENSSWVLLICNYFPFLRSSIQEESSFLSHDISRLILISDFAKSFLWLHIIML